MKEIKAVDDSKVIYMEDFKKKSENGEKKELKVERIKRTTNTFERTHSVKKRKKKVKYSNNKYINEVVEEMQELLKKENFAAMITQTTLKFAIEENDKYFTLANKYMAVFEAAVNDFYYKLFRLEDKSDIETLKNTFKLVYLNLRKKFACDIVKLFCENELSGYVQKLQCDIISPWLKCDSICSILYSFLERVEHARKYIKEENKEWEERLQLFADRAHEIYLKYVDLYVDNEYYIYVKDMIAKRVSVYDIDSLRKVYSIKNDKLDFNRYEQLAEREIEYIFRTCILNYQEFIATKDKEIEKLYQIVNNETDNEKYLKLNQILASLVIVQDMEKFNYLKNLFYEVVNNTERVLKK